MDLNKGKFGRGAEAVERRREQMMFADRAGEIEPEGVPTEITTISKSFFSCCLAASGFFSSHKHTLNIGALTDATLQTDVHTYPRPCQARSLQRIPAAALHNLNYAINPPSALMPSSGFVCVCVIVS